MPISLSELVGLLRRHSIDQDHGFIEADPETPGEFNVNGTINLQAVVNELNEHHGL